jgi:Icc-related predicted phosphoesterase
MKILAIGDFHGKFPGWIKKVVKREKIDLVLSNGDYLPFAYRKLWFKHCYGKDVDLWEVVGKKKYKELILGDLRAGERALKGLNDLPVPVVTTLGNIDYPSPDDCTDRRFPFTWKWAKDTRFKILDFIKQCSNITRCDYKVVKVGGFVFIGGRGHTVPGRVKSKAYRKHRKILDGLFKKYKKENGEGKVIFLTHNMPNDTRLDKIGMHAHKEVRGKHYGSKLFRRIIEKWQPSVQTGGHIHEAKGKQKLGKTLMVNAGAAHEGDAAVIEIVGKKVKVKFIK